MAKAFRFNCGVVIAMLLSELSVTLASTVVIALDVEAFCVVVVTGPPLRFSVKVRVDLLKVSG